jgi:hypothetical protein
LFILIIGIYSPFCQISDLLVSSVAPNVHLSVSVWVKFFMGHVFKWVWFKMGHGVNDQASGVIITSAKVFMGLVNKW